MNNYAPGESGAIHYTPVEVTCSDCGEVTNADLVEQLGGADLDPDTCECGRQFDDDDEVERC